MNHKNLDQTHISDCYLDDENFCDEFHLTKSNKKYRHENCNL